MKVMRTVLLKEYRCKKYTDFKLRDGGKKIEEFRQS